MCLARDQKMQKPKQSKPGSPLISLLFISMSMLAPVSNIVPLQKLYEQLSVLNCFCLTSFFANRTLVHTS